jgi:hypothetical protein
MMNAAVQEGLAQHYQALASLSPEQRAALNRQAMCRNAVSLDGHDERYWLERIFEREAAAQSNGH